MDLGLLNSVRSKTLKAVKDTDDYQTNFLKILDNFIDKVDVYLDEFIQYAVTDQFLDTVLAKAMENKDNCVAKELAIDFEISVPRFEMNFHRSPNDHEPRLYSAISAIISGMSWHLCERYDMPLDSFDTTFENGTILSQWRGDYYYRTGSVHTYPNFLWNRKGELKSPKYSKWHGEWQMEDTYMTCTINREAFNKWVRTTGVKHLKKRLTEYGVIVKGKAKINDEENYSEGITLTIKNPLIEE